MDLGGREGRVREQQHACYCSRHASVGQADPPLAIPSNVLRLPQHSVAVRYRTLADVPPRASRAAPAQEKLVVAAFPMLQLATEELSEAGHRVRLAVARVLKAAPHKRVDWAKVRCAVLCCACGAECGVLSAVRPACAAALRARYGMVPTQAGAFWVACWQTLASSRHKVRAWPDMGQSAALPGPSTAHVPAHPPTAAPAAPGVQVALSAGCVALAALLYRSNAANRKLAGLLAQRDAELADVVSIWVGCRDWWAGVEVGWRDWWVGG